MKKFFSLSFIAASLLFVSCKKEKVDGPVQAPTKKLKETTFDENRSFTYNADGTIKEIAMIGYDHKESYTYNQGNVGFLQVVEGKKIGEGIISVVNGKAVSFNYTTFNSSGMVMGNYLETYTYNEKGLVKRRTNTDGSYKEFTYDANNDLVLSVDYTPQAVAYQKAEFTYSNQKDMFPQYGYHNYSDVCFFLPAFSKHLPASHKVTSLVNGNVSLDVTFVYELDAQGYAVMGKIVGSQFNWEWTNIYQ